MKTTTRHDDQPDKRQHTRVLARCRNCNTGTLVPLGHTVPDCPDCKGTVLELEAVQQTTQAASFGSAREAFADTDLWDGGL